ncbi:MAG: AbrB/MazE/SpoVT family DNA-binding domain-containing protein [Haliangium ochraceum]
MPSASLTSKGQVTVPKVIRDLLKIETGDRLDFVIEGDRIVLRPGTRDLRELRGALHRPGRKAVSLEAMSAAVARFHGRRP